MKRIIPSEKCVSMLEDWNVKMEELERKQIDYEYNEFMDYSFKNFINELSMIVDIDGDSIQDMVLKMILQGILEVR